MTNPTAQTIKRHAHAKDPMGHCTLTYDDRFLRRKMLATDDGVKFLVDLENTESLNQGDAFVLGDGQMIEVHAAPEPLYQVTGDNLVQLAWHVGNRHTPCQIEADHLLIQADPVIGHMLEHLGAQVAEVTAPFTPEGGAYGHGRTHSHEHVATAHDH
ncbi:urease accessory protein UreE [Octadecabacter sp. CECT 8868]|uniref:urease accessory protein UreE n=1 Tax=Octadecabacter algicola TaxID=2909342 RepID=UPI001F3B9A1B|nr:urease accessory protein UreE [Octadecabacter algicola]MCF2904244.1 urease accessory protein UreE [Octadecabacter algicola]